MTARIESERQLIETYLAPLSRGVPGAFALTDDAALLTPPAGMSLVVTTDPIIAGVHFFPTDRADDIAWKALAVNISDLAAKGAEPLAYTMTLSFPEAPEPKWMEQFAQGLLSAQTDFGCHLIGGDTDRTPGPLSIGITAIGTVPEGKFVRGQGARARDEVFVTGTLGDAAVGLMLHRDASLFGDALTEGDKSLLVGRYLRPSPRVGLAAVLRAHASAALDISDGFLKDVSRLAGTQGLIIEMDALPLSQSVRAALGLDAKIAEAVLGGGDDYEILAAVPTESARDFVSEAARVGINVSRVGVLDDGGAIRVVGRDGGEISPMRSGYDHFQA